MSKYRLTVDYDPDTERPDNNATKEYTMWAKGETYTYVLESLSTCDECGHVASDIMIDSCGGIIGLERLIEMVREAIEVVVDANDIEIGGRRGYVIRTSDLISDENALTEENNPTTSEISIGDDLAIKDNSTELPPLRKETKRVVCRTWGPGDTYQTIGHDGPQVGVMGDVKDDALYERWVSDWVPIEEER